MVATIEARRLKARIGEGGELAILDVRERGAFGRGHLLFASCLPLGRLELLIADLVPRRAAPVVLCDGGGGEARRAADRLAELGYSDVAVLKGGVEAWAAAGFRLFRGVNVPSKAFGEVVEQCCATPHIGARDLKARLDAGARIVVLDSRPLDEFRAMCIPGGIDVPGAELLYRVHDLAPDPGTVVVVNCAGRTRSIIGAQSLINAGLPNPVMALENGTMGWHLAGFELERGSARVARAPSALAMTKARAAADRVADRFRLRRLDGPELARLQGEGQTRSLYLLDVRTEAEFEAGHLHGARWAPGGQLVQGTDDYMATRGARVVLVDDIGVRAGMTASWLVQMGWSEVVVLALSDCPELPLEAGPRAPEVLGLPAEVATLDVDELRSRMDDTTVVDLRPSAAHRDSHIPGAWFALRTHLANDLCALPAAPRLVLVSEHGLLARFAAAECGHLWQGEVAVLKGGMQAWRAAGLALESGLDRLASEPDDEYLRPYDRQSRVEQAMRDYIAWEIGLVAEIEADGDAKFSVLTG